MKETLFERSELVNSHNRGMTRSLFLEFQYIDRDIAPLMTLSRTEWKGYTSIYMEYMKFDTEYDAAMWILGDWDHWLKLCKTTWFKEYRDAWEQERVTKQQAQARKILIEAADAGSVPAAKLIYEDKKIVAKRGKGRPTIAEKEAAIKKEIKVSHNVSDITKRMKKFE